MNYVASGDDDDGFWNRIIALVIIVVILGCIALGCLSCVVISQQTGTPTRGVEKHSAKDSGAVLKAEKK